MKIQLKLNGQVTSATLANNRTAREFVAMLPLTITMHDLFAREKFGALPAAISGKATGTRARRCEAGDIVCWSPGPDVAIFYRGAIEPVRGAHRHLGKLDFGAEAFEGADPLEVTIERYAGVAPAAISRTRSRHAHCAPAPGLRKPAAHPRFGSAG